MSGWIGTTNSTGPPKKDPTAVPRLIRAIADYLQWMNSVNYTAASQHQHRMQLEMFSNFVKNHHLHWQQLFSVNAREDFKNTGALRTTAAVNALSRYLVEKGQIKMPLPQHPSPRKLAGIFEEYLQFRQDSRQTNVRQLNAIRRVLSALCD